MIRDYFTFSINNELGPAPSNDFCLFGTLIIECAVSAEELVDWVSIHSVYVNLREHGSGKTVLSHCELFDFCFSSRLLFPELIAREGKDFKTLLFELLVELNHFFVVIISQASLANNVYDQCTLLAFKD